MLIGFCGLAGSGKSTAATVLVNAYRFFRMSFAGPLRTEGARWLEANPVAATILGVTVEDLWEKPTSPEARRFLQRFGTNYWRHQDPEHWTKAAENKLDSLPKEIENVVFDDVRFPDEAAMIRRRGGVIWKIIRPGVEPLQHESEGQDLGNPDVTTFNNGSLEELERLVQLFVNFRGGLKNDLASCY